MLVGFFFSVQKISLPRWPCSKTNGPLLFKIPAIGIGRLFAFCILFDEKICHLVLGAYCCSNVRVAMNGQVVNPFGTSRTINMTSVMLKRSYCGVLTATLRQRNPVFEAWGS